MMIKAPTNSEYVCRGDLETREGTLMAVTTIAFKKHSYAFDHGT